MRPAADSRTHCRFANAWTRLGLTQSLAELPSGLLDSPELVSSSSYAASGSLPSSTSAGGGGGSGSSALDTTAYAPGSQVRGQTGCIYEVFQQRKLEGVLFAAYVLQTSRPLAVLQFAAALPCSALCARMLLNACLDCSLLIAVLVPTLSYFLVQKMRVEGEVLRWHHENGKEVVPALQYIEQLEAELADLRQQVGHSPPLDLP